MFQAGGGDENGVERVSLAHFDPLQFSSYTNSGILTFVFYTDVH